MGLQLEALTILHLFGVFCLCMCTLLCSTRDVMMEGHCGQHMHMGWVRECLPGQAIAILSSPCRCLRIRRGKRKRCVCQIVRAIFMHARMLCRACSCVWGRCWGRGREAGAVHPAWWAVLYLWCSTREYRGGPVGGCDLKVMGICRWDANLGVGSSYRFSVCCSWVGTPAAGGPCDQSCQCSS